MIQSAREAGCDIWFAFDESRPLPLFAGLWSIWTSVRRGREGEVTADLFGFLTTPPNAEVGALWIVARGAKKDRATRSDVASDAAELVLNKVSLIYAQPSPKPRGPQCRAC